MVEFVWKVSATCEQLSVQSDSTLHITPLPTPPHPTGPLSVEVVDITGWPDAKVVAIELKCSVQTVYRMFDSGELKGQNLCAGRKNRRVKFDPASVNARRAVVLVNK